MKYSKISKLTASGRTLFTTVPLCTRNFPENIFFKKGDKCLEHIFNSYPNCPCKSFRCLRPLQDFRRVKMSRLHAPERVGLLLSEVQIQNGLSFVLIFSDLCWPTYTLTTRFLEITSDQLSENPTALAPVLTESLQPFTISQVTALSMFFPRITTSVYRRPVVSSPLAAVSTEKQIDAIASEIVRDVRDVRDTGHGGGQRETLSSGHDVLVCTLPANAPVPRALARDTREPAFAHAPHAARVKDPLHPCEVACFQPMDLRPECRHGVKSAATVR